MIQRPFPIASILAGAVAAAIVFPASARAQDSGPDDRGSGPGVSVSVQATAVSDYRFRGISRSGGDPALQASATLLFGGGAYVGAWGSTLGDSRITTIHRPPYDAGNVELDLYAGYDLTLPTGTGIDVGANYVTFHGDDSGTDYVEPYASVRHTLGPVEARAGGAYRFGAGGADDSLYLYGQARAGIPLTPLTLEAKIGRTGSADALRADYIDWSLGADFVVGPATLGVRYVDTDLEPTGVRATDRLAKPTVVVSLGVGF